jgi:putative FmdB family regulatory protein
MPLYEFRCHKCGKSQELLMPLEKANLSVVRCDCGGIADRMVSMPIFHGCESGVAPVDEMIYRTHNVTRTETVRIDGGTVTKRPAPVSDQCHCGNCSSHRRKNVITGVASPGKEV